MNSNKNENLEQLLRQFIDESQAGPMAAEIERGDRLFDSHPAPAVSRRLQQAVCAGMHRQIQHEHRVHLYRRWFSIATVAALLMIGLFVLQSDNDRPFERPIEKPYLAAAAGEWRLTEKVPLTDIQRELGRLSEEINTLDSKTYESVNPLRFDLLELEQIEAITSNTEFWKG